MASQQWFTVPAGTVVTRCRSARCLKDIYFIAHPRTGRPHPIDCSVEGGLRPSINPKGTVQQDIFDQGGVEGHDGRGVSHFETCVDAPSFRGPTHG